MQFAILVSTMIALLLGTFLTLTYTHRFFDQQSDMLLQSTKEAQKGIEYILQSKDQSFFKDSIIVNNENFQTIIKSDIWGGFTRVNATAKIKTKSFTKLALIGASLPDPKTSVYVAESQMPLVLVGNTRIEGAAYLSDQEVKAGVISGNYYYGEILIHGTIERSTAELPALVPEWREAITNFLKFIPSENEKVVEIQPLNKNSFFEEPEVIYAPEKLILNETYIGNIIIKSDTEITITANARLTDVTVIAPKIKIERGFNGNASFIASQQIKLEEHVVLSYPSALVIQANYTEESPIQPPGEEPIYLSSYAEIAGIIVYLKDEMSPPDSNLRSQVNIEIQPLAIVQGMVYCEGNIELSGTVKGTVFTELFIANQSGSRYINHIYNGQILANDISDSYCGLPFINTKKGVVKWLY